MMKSSGNPFVMRKLLTYSALMILSMLLIGCVQDIFTNETIDIAWESYPVLTAGFEDAATKTYVEDKKHLRWNAGDRISAFYGSTLNSQYQFDGNTGDNSGTFSYIPSGRLETGNPLDVIYAVYPYGKDTRVTEDGVISLLLPDVQYYGENSFGVGANTMVAVTENLTDTFLSFKNVCGYIKLQLYGCGIIQSIELSGNMEEKIAGAAVVTPVIHGAPAIALEDDASDNIILNCLEGVELEPSAENIREFWIVVPPMTFEKGISITVTNSDGQKYSKCTKKPIVVERNTVQPMAALAFPGDFYAEGSNIVEYTATKKFPIGHAFDSEVIAHNFDENTRKGKIICSSPITKVEDGAFDRLYLWDEGEIISVILPQTVIEIGDRAFALQEKMTRLHLKSPTPPSLGSDVFVANKFFEELIFVPATAYNDYMNNPSWANLTMWPYDYAKDYPDIPDNEIWYTGPTGFQETPLATPEMVTEWTVLENTYDSKTGKGRVVLKDAVRVIYNELFDNPYDKRNLRGIIVPHSVHSIESGAFGGGGGEDEMVYFYAPRNVSVNFDWTGNTGTGSYWQAFLGCKSLIEFAGRCSPDGCSIVYNGSLDAFVGSDIVNYKIPKGIQKIGQCAFYGKNKLKNITFSPDLKFIGSRAFSWCSSITEITIPSNVSSIDYEAFSSCTSITEITIPDNVNSIGSAAFSGCESLRTVHIGAGVDFIGYNAFSDCSSLEAVYCKAMIPPTVSGGSSYNQELFYSTSPDLIIYVPLGASPAYKLDSYWGKYSARIREIAM